jgi:hypothetical protein
VVRNWEIKAQQPEHAPDEPFCLAQSQVKDQPQREHKLNRQSRVPCLTAWRGSPRSIPFGDSVLIEPESQVTTAL